MTTVIKINRIILEILISVLFALLALQTAYAGGKEEDNNNAIIVTADGIAKVVDSNGEISFSQTDRNIKKGEIKFGVILADIPTLQVKNMKLNNSPHRVGKVCVNNNLNKDLRNFYLHPYDDENDHNYCLVEIK